MNRFCVTKTGASDLPYEVFDSQNYGFSVAVCSSRSVARLLAKTLNETRPSTRKDKT
jgi:hypothetical protein